MQDVSDRRVLMIANEFPPVSNAGVQRPLYFCRYLPEFGWKPVVLTVKDVVHFAYDSTLLDVLPPEVRIVRTESMELRRVLWHVRRIRAKRQPAERPPATAGVSGSEQAVSAQTRDFGRALRRWLFVPDDRILWLPFALRAGAQVCRSEPIRAIYGTVPSYSVATIGVAISKKTGLPLILDLRDPWTGDPYHQGPTALHRLLSRRMEAAALRHARKVIVICEDMKRFFLRKYPDLPESKIAVITNGYDAEEMRSATPVRNDRFTVVYSGTLYAHHAEVFEAFCKAWSDACIRSPEFQQGAQFRAVGRTDPEITAIAGRYPKMRAQFLGNQPHSAALRHLTGASLLLLLIKNVRRDAQSVITIPGKVFEYIGSQRPILMIGPDGDAARVVGETGRAWAYRQDDTAGVSERLLRQFAGQQAADGAAPAQFGRFERRVLARDLAAQFNQACGTTDAALRSGSGRL